jgi:hypothetical protein
VNIHALRNGSNRQNPLQLLRRPPRREDGRLLIEIRIRNGMLGVGLEAG